MRIWIVCPVFPPEPVVSAQISAQIATELASQGHKVTVLTAFPNRPSGKLYPGYSVRLYKREKTSQGFELIRCFSTISPHSSIISRTIENLSFGITSGLYLLFSPKPGVIYSNTWPILATGIARLVASFRKIPLVICVQDVYPESMVSQRRIKENGLIFKFLLAIDLWIIKGCSTVITISEQFARNYREKRMIASGRIKVIPNWVDEEAVTPLPKILYRQENKIPEDAFVLVYGGNVGAAAGVETVLQILGRVRSNRKIVFIVAGSGSQLAACQELAARIKNIRILFHTPWAAEDTSKVLAAADVLILPTQGSQSLASVPSKLLSYFLASRPVLAIVLPESDTARIIEHAGCGWVIPPGNQDLLIKKIEELCDLSAQKIDKMGSAGRRYAQKNFTTEACLPKVIKIIEDAARG